jgi:hypothetical protein
MLGKNQTRNNRKIQTDYNCKNIAKIVFRGINYVLFMTITVMRVCLSTFEAAVYIHVHSA